MRITEAEQEIRHNRMLHTAYELFCEQGIDNVTMEKVAVAANVSTNSVIRYFSNKADLLEQTQAILWDEIVSCITSGNAAACDSAANGFEELRVLLYGFQHLYEEHSKYLMFAYEYKAYLIRKRIHLPQAAYERTLRPVRAVFVPALERGQADGSITTSLPVSQQFLIIWGIMRSFVEQLLIHGTIYEGDTPWEAMFPFVVGKILEHLQP